VDDQELADRLRGAGVRRGDLVGLAVTPDGTVAVSPGGAGTIGQLATADDEVRPRWVTW
jgi:hypothetical protein